MNAIRRGCIVAACVCLVLSSAFPASAGSLTGPTGITVSGWSLNSTGPNTISGGSMTAGSVLSSYTVTVVADKAKMSEYASGAYVAGGKSLSAALHVITVRTGGSGLLCAGSGADVAVGTSGATVASGPGGVACSDIYSVTLSQATSIADNALASGHSYHIVLTYTLSGGL